MVSSKMMNSMKSIGDGEGVETGVCSVRVGNIAMELKRIVASKVNKIINSNPYYSNSVDKSGWRTHKCEDTEDRCASAVSFLPSCHSFWCDKWLNSAGKGLWLEIELQNYVQLFDDVTIQVKINSKFVQDLMITGRSNKMLRKVVPMYSVVNIHDTPEHTALGESIHFVSAPHHSGASIVGIKTKKVFEDGKFKPGASP